MTDILTLNNVTKEYTEGKKALADINFTVKEEEFVSIIGKSGAGKSTLLRCINRMIEPTNGEIIFDDKDTTDLGNKGLRELRRQMGMIFQNYNLVNRSSVLTNVLHGRLGYMNAFKGTFGIFSDEDKLKAYNILINLGLEEQSNKRADQLSGGQQQRVGIARALIQNPKLMLCDEPIASLDPYSSKVIMEYLKQINEEMKITVICNLHQVDVAQAYSTRILGVAEGKIVFDGSPSELTEEAIHEIYGTSDGDLITDVNMAAVAE